MIRVRSSFGTSDLLHCKHIAHLTTPTQGDFWILKMSFGLCSKNLAENCSSNLKCWPSLISLGAGAASADGSA